MIKQGTGCLGRGGEGVGGPPSLMSHHALRGKKKRDYKKDRTSGVVHPTMNPALKREQEDLLTEFEAFTLDLEVEEILKDVKRDCVQDESVDQFAQQLEQRDRQKRVAQIEREAQVQQQWSPGHYPQLTCDWFVEGLDYCCDYWCYQKSTKRSTTPPPRPRKCQKKTN